MFITNCHFSLNQNIAEPSKPLATYPLGPEQFQKTSCVVGIKTSHLLKIPYETAMPLCLICISGEFKMVGV